MMHQYSNIDQYIAGFPKEIQAVLEQLRTIVKETAPGAEEAIGYGIPTLKLKGNLVHFAAYKNHIGFYPGASGIHAFESELSAYPCSKGTVQFPLDQPLPVDLIIRIVQYRIRENLEKSALKTKKTVKTCPNGHPFEKSSDCPVCPVCERERMTKDSFLTLLAAPARRALENHGVATLEQLAGYSELEILSWHGMGPGSLPKLRSALADKGLSFKIV